MPSVLYGETFADIAKRLGEDAYALKKANGGGKPIVGTKIKRPRKRDRRERMTDTGTGGNVIPKQQGYYDAGLGVTSKGPSTPEKPVNNKRRRDKVPQPEKTQLDWNDVLYMASPTNTPNPNQAPNQPVPDYRTEQNLNKIDPHMATYENNRAPSYPAQRMNRPDRGRPGFGAGESLDATAPGIADYFFGAMAGFDPFGYEWDQNGQLIENGEQAIDARIPVALPGNMVEVVNDMPADQQQEWMAYLSAAYHYDPYSDQWIVNSGEDFTPGVASGGGYGGYGYGGYRRPGGGGGGGGYGYGGGTSPRQIYDNAVNGLVNWRGNTYA